MDSSYIIAAVVRDDQYHQRARELYERIDHDNIPLLTTHAVLLEVGNHLAAQPYRSTFLAVIRDLRQDPASRVVKISDELFRRGLHFFAERHDKTWGFVDCISFVVMEQHEITEALTTDEHFQQAGFTALLRT